MRPHVSHSDIRKLEPKADIANIFAASGYRTVWLGGREINRTFVGTITRRGQISEIDGIITSMAEPRRRFGVKTLDEP
jgi:hypothetical protein